MSTYQSETYSVYYVKDIVDVNINKAEGLKQNSFELQMLDSKFELHAENEKDLKMWLRAFSWIFEIRARERLKLKSEADIESFLERH